MMTAPALPPSSHPSQQPIILVEDHAMTRMGLRLMLEQLPDLTVLGEAADGQEAVALVERHANQAPLVLMDIGLPEMDGVEATQRIKQQHPNVKVMMLTSKDEGNDVFAALGSGADAYCLKTTEPDQLATAIRTVAEGAAWLHPAIARMVMGRFQGTPANPTVGNKSTGALFSVPTAHGSPNQTLDCPLTPREMEVLKLIVDGMSNADIADALVITKATAKAHVHSILQKLCVDDRTQAAVLAMRQGFV